MRLAREAKRLRALVLVQVLVMMALSTTGCLGRKASSYIMVVGSTALQPLVEEAANQFMDENPDAQVVVQGGGSGAGLSQVSQGGADIGNSDIFAEEIGGQNVTGLVDHKVCVTGIACIINPDINIESLTRKQIAGIFRGAIVNWNQLGGPDQEIVVVHRPKGSGTRLAFKSTVLDGAEELPYGLEQDSSGAVRQIISDTPGAISYLALPYVDDSVKVIAVDGVLPTPGHIAEGEYPVWAYEHMYTKGEPSALVKEFLEHMLSPEVQNELVPKMGYVPISSMKIERDAAGEVIRE